MKLGDVLYRIHELDPYEGWEYVEPIGDLPEVWYCVEDVNLRIEHHLERDVVMDPFEEDWATRHPDKHAVSYVYRIWYGNTLLHDAVLVHVDGHRAILPMPEPGTKIVKSGSLEFKVAEIVNRGGRLMEYIQRSGLTLE